MSETVGEVMRRLFGVYDYITFKQQKGNVTYKWSKVPAEMEMKKFRSYNVVDGVEMSKRMEVPSEALSTLYLYFEM